MKTEQYFFETTVVKQETPFESCYEQIDISNGGIDEETKTNINTLLAIGIITPNLQTDAEENDAYVDKYSDYEDTTQISKEKKVKKNKKKKKRNKKKKKLSSKEEEHPKTADSKIENSTSKKFDSTEHLHKIPKYFHMNCEICSKPFSSFKSARKHYKSAHDTLGYLQCCEKKFYLLHRIAQHCMLHENPDAFK